MTKISDKLRKAVYPRYTTTRLALGAESLSGKCCEYLYWHEGAAQRGGKKDLVRALLETPANQRESVVALAKKYDRATKKYYDARRGGGGAGMEASGEAAAKFIACMASASERVREVFAPLFTNQSQGREFLNRGDAIVERFTHVFETRSDDRLLTCLDQAHHTSIALSRVTEVVGPGAAKDVLSFALQFAELPPQTDVRRFAARALAFYQENAPTTYWLADMEGNTLSPQTLIQVGATVHPTGDWPEGAFTRPDRFRAQEAEAQPEQAFQPRLAHPDGRQRGQAAQPRLARPDAQMQHILNNDQNVHQSERIDSTNRSADALAKAINFDMSPRKNFGEHIKKVEFWLHALQKAGPGNTPAWMWRPRAGRANEIENALHAVNGAQRDADYTGPIATNQPMARLLALVWQSIEEFPKTPHQETDAVAAQAAMRQGLVHALAECIEVVDRGISKRVCNIGISQRLLSVLQGYYPQVALDNFEVSPENLVSALAERFAEEHGDEVTQKQVDAFREASVQTARNQFNNDPEKLRVFTEALDGWISYDLTILGPAEDAVPDTGAAWADKLIADFQAEHAARPDAASLSDFRQHAQTALSNHWTPQSPQWREGIARIANYVRAARDAS